MEYQLGADIERCRRRLAKGRGAILESLDGMIGLLEEFRAATQPAEPEAQCQLRIQTLFTAVSGFQPLKKICHEHRESYVYLSKLSKSIDCAFPSDLELLKSHESSPLNEGVLQEVVHEHLVRTGYYEECELLEQHFPISPECRKTKEKFREIHSLTDALAASEVDVAILWLQQHSSELRSELHDLLFSLHRLKIIHALRAGDTFAVFEYLKSISREYIKTHRSEIDQLSGASLFLSQPENTPYQELMDPEFDQFVVRRLTEEWCRAIGLPRSSGFLTVFAAGSAVLKDLVEIGQVVGSKVWTEPLPAELALSSELKFHSIFVCPVSREIATPENPPMLLPCGHLICKSSLERMMSGTVRKVKCPTCPVEVGEEDVRMIFIM